ncbi:MAG TPA: hypothetical protein VKA18_06055 [Alphaproteobacteria bacterium]|nr:hypothetical protein [Alphaproteobacteria bacterium]
MQTDAGTMHALTQSGLTIKAERAFNRRQITRRGRLEIDFQNAFIRNKRFNHCQPSKPPQLFRQQQISRPVVVANAAPSNAQTRLIHEY